MTKIKWMTGSFVSDIIPVKVIKETPRGYKVEHPSPIGVSAKQVYHDSGYAKVHDSFEKAKEYLIKENKEQTRRLKVKAKLLESRLEKLKSLKEPTL